MRNSLSGKELGDFSRLGAEDAELKKAHRPDTPPGVLYKFERKGVAGKGICKCVEIKGLQIDQGGRGICKCMKRKERRKSVVDGG